MLPDEILYTRAALFPRSASVAATDTTALPIAACSVLLAGYVVLVKMGVLSLASVMITVT